jgi:hypothetical protein
MEKKNFWQITPEELKKQVSEYDTLPFSKSYRKVSAGLLVFSMFLGLLLAVFGMVDLKDVLVSFVLYLLVAYFVYKGSKNALKAAMVLWTVEKGFQIITTPKAAISAIIWWGLFLTYFYKAYKVEVAKEQAQVVSGAKPGSDPVIDLPTNSSQK